MKQVLVTGGTGIAGRALVMALVDRGVAVRVLARTPVREGTGVLPGVSYSAADITCADAVREALQGVDVVFHLAGKKGADPGETLSQESFDRVNVEGTRILVNAAAATNVKRLVFFSSISVYGTCTHGQIMDEMSVPVPDSGYGLSKIKAESIVLGAKNAEGKSVGVVLRVASVYGPWGKKSYAMFIAMVRHGIFVALGRNKVARTLVHDTDLARAAILAAEHPNAPGMIYNVTDGCIHTIADMGEAIGRALGRTYVTVHIPLGLSKAVMGLIAKLELSFSFLSAIRNLIGRMSMDTAVLGDKIQQELGFRPGVDLDQGWRDAVLRYLNKRQ